MHQLFAAKSRKIALFMGINGTKSPEHWVFTFKDNLNFALSKPIWRPIPEIFPRSFHWISSAIFNFYLRGRTGAWDTHRGRNEENDVYHACFEPLSPDKGHLLSNSNKQ